MLICNKYNYDEAVVNAAKGEIYKPVPEVLRVTELINPPLIKYLTMKHWDNINIDVDDLLLTLEGNAWHQYLAGWLKATCPNVMADKIWTLHHAGSTIKGETDIYYPTGIIEDNKVTSVWSFVFGHSSWEKQLNCYAYLVKHNGYPVTQLTINAFLRDWSYFEAQKAGNWTYPKHRFHKVKVKLWPIEEQKQYIKERLELFGKEPTECDDVWEKKTTYAVMKEGQKKALRVLDSMQQASDWRSCTPKGSNTYIVERPGERTRCERYCNVNKFCPYYGR